ncbi:MAG: hypothetical protein QGG40_19875, partial [Myxococcota bacterium]|nr:hypothetical protein [Myxococcota bacterium]
MLAGPWLACDIEQPVAPEEQAPREAPAEPAPTWDPTKGLVSDLPREPPDMVLFLASGLRADQGGDEQAVAALLEPLRDQVRVEFRSSYAQTTSPYVSVGSVLTGHYPSAIPLCGYKGTASEDDMEQAWCIELPEDRQTLPEVLALYGYRTALFYGNLLGGEVFEEQFQHSVDLTEDWDHWQLPWDRLEQELVSWWEADSTAPRLVVIVAPDLMVQHRPDLREDMGLSRMPSKVETPGPGFLPTGGDRGIVAPSESGLSSFERQFDSREFTQDIVNEIHQELGLQNMAPGPGNGRQGPGGAFPAQESTVESGAESPGGADGPVANEAIGGVGARTPGTGPGGGDGDRGRRAAGGDLRDPGANSGGAGGPRGQGAGPPRGQGAGASGAAAGLRRGQGGGGPGGQGAGAGGPGGPRGQDAGAGGPGGQSSGSGAAGLRRGQGAGGPGGPRGKAGGGAGG